VDDPLEVADRLGRPVAIVRLGGRLPDAMGPDQRFLYGSPPVLIPNALDLYSEHAAEVPTGDGAFTSNSAKTPPPLVDKDRGQSEKDEKGKVVLAAAEVEAGKPSAPSEKSDTQRATDFDRKHSSRRLTPVVKVASPKRNQDPAWQSNKPAPVSVSISDDE